MANVNFNLIINEALFKANNRDNLKSYIIRQSKIANRDAFYELEDFSKGLIKVATGKMQGLELVFHTWKSRLQNRINNIDYEYFIEPPSSHSRTIDEITEFQKIEREKHLKKWKLELENCTINDFNYHKNEYRRLEIIIDVVNEINNINNNNEKTNNPDWSFTALQWSTIFYYAHNKGCFTKKTISANIKAFIKKHNVGNTFGNLRNKYYEACRRINERADYPIGELKEIIPFLEHHYKDTVEVVKNDISFLKDEMAENE